MKKVKYLVTLAAFASIYFMFLYYRCSLIPIDSDYSNLVLEAADILQGNVFRNNWHLTGISFLTTDLLYFIVGVAFAGVSKQAYYFAVALMQFVLAIASLKLLCSGKNKLSISEWAIFISIGLIPCLFTIELLRAHTGVFVWIFLGIFCVQQVINDVSKKNMYFFLLTFLVALGVMSDPIILVIGVLPLFIWGIGCLIIRKERNVLQVKIMLFSLSGVILGVMADKLYFWIGNANKNSFLSSKYFESLDDYGRKFLIYVRALLRMMDCQFESTPIVHIRTIIYFINTIVLICALVLIVKTIIDFFRGKEYDLITLLLGVGFVLISLLFVITNISVNILSARYLGYFPIMFAIIIVRHIRWENLKQLEVKIFLVGISMLLLLWGGIRSFRDTYVVREWEQLATFLEENNLKSGYASFWYASSVTVLTNEKVKVRSVLTDNGKITPNRWFCKEDWYSEPANFILVSEGEHPDNINSQLTMSTLGVPVQILEFNNYDIYIYDTDISQYIK